MSSERIPRTSDTREATSRKKVWTPPTVMPEPNPKEGWTHRWVRTSAGGKHDNTNVSSKFRQGWEPAPAEEYPEITVMRDRNSEFNGNIEVGGLLLCRMPNEVIGQRREYYNKLAQDQMKSVESNLMRESDPRMPLSRPEVGTKVTFGSGRG
jgi:hypothetical protein